MNDFFKIVGGIAIGALAMYLIINFFGKKCEPEIVFKDRIVEVTPNCPEIQIDSIEIYETVRKGLLKKTKPGKVKPDTVINENTEPVTKMASYVYEDSLLYVGETILYQGEILDFSRSIKLDTLTIERNFTKTITKEKIVEIEKEVPVVKEKIINDAKFRIVAGGSAYFDERFRAGISAGIKTKKDIIIAYEYVLPPGIQANKKGTHSLKLLWPLKIW